MCLYSKGGLAPSFVFSSVYCGMFTYDPTRKTVEIHIPGSLKRLDFNTISAKIYAELSLFHSSAPLIRLETLQDLWAPEPPKFAPLVVTSCMIPITHTLLDQLAIRHNCPKELLSHIPIASWIQTLSPKTPAFVTIAADTLFDPEAIVEVEVVVGQRGRSRKDSASANDHYFV